MLVDCYYRSRSSNVVWGYLRPQTTAAALAVPHPSPFSLLPSPPPAPPLSSLLVLLPRREVEGARRTTLPLLHPHPVAILPPLLSSPLPLAPPVVVACAPSPAASQGGVHHDARDPPPPAIVVIRVGGTIAISRQVPIIIAPAIPFPSSIASFVVVASRRALAPPPRS